VLPWKCNNEFPLYCCGATKYVVSFSTTETQLGLRVKMPDIFFSNFNLMWILSTNFRTSPWCQTSPKSGRWEPCWHKRTDRRTWRSYHKLFGALCEHAKNGRPIASRCKWKLTFTRISDVLLCEIRCRSEVIRFLEI